MQYNIDENKRNMMTTGKKVQNNQPQSYQPPTPMSRKNIDFFKVIE